MTAQLPEPVPQPTSCLQNPDTELGLALLTANPLRQLLPSALDAGGSLETE